MKAVESAARIILYFRKSSKEKSRKSWLSWRELVLAIYSSDHSDSEISHVINQSSVKYSTFSSEAEVASFINGLGDDKQMTASLIQLYLDTEKGHGDFLALKQHQDILNTISGEVPDVDKLRSAAWIQSQEWLEMARDKRFSTEIFIPATLKIITLDYVFRWLLLGFYRLGGGAKDTWNIDIEGILIVGNVLIIPIIVSIIAYFRDRRVQNRTAMILGELNIRNLKLVIRNTAWNYSLLAFYVTSGVLIFSLINLAQNATDGISILASVLYFVYLFTLLRVYSSVVPKIAEVKNQLELKKHRELDIELGVDENDEEIVNLDVNLRSVNERMNSFVLEAALLGALAFSCFLQIIATDEFTISSIEDFSRGIVNLLGNLVNFQWAGTQDILLSLGSKEGLLSLMCYQSLLCAAFFLAVIASRLQFSALTDFVDRAINLSKSFNAKEEALVHGHQIDVKDERVVAYNKRIREELKTGYRKQGEIEPIMEFMSFFRTLGVTTFFIIVITGGLFVSVQLSVVLLLISLLSAFYFKINELIMAMKGLSVRIGEFSARYNKHLSWAAWITLTLAVITRSLEILPGGALLIIGFELFVLQHILLLFVPNPDEIKTESNANVATLSNRMRIYFLIIFILSVLAVQFKFMHWPGSAVMLILSSILLATFLFSSPKLKEGPKWMGRIVSFGLGMFALAFLFKILYWPVSGLVYKIATIPMLFSVYVLIRKWKLLSRLNRRAILYYSGIMLCLYVPFLGHSFVSMKVDYAEYLESGVIWMYEDKIGEWVQADNDAYPDSVIRYMNLMEAKIEAEDNPSKYGNAYNETAWNIYLHRDDSVVLAKALEWSNRSIQYSPIWIYIDTKAALLYKLGRYNEAEAEAVKAIELGAEQETEQLLKDIREKL